MELPPLNKSTEATVDVVPQLELDGSYAAVVVIKQSFGLGRRGEVRRTGGAVLRPIDTPWDPDADQSSPKYPSDVCIRKPSTDVVVVGRAYAPGGKPAQEVEVSVRVGPLQRRLRVHGPRVFYRGTGGMALSAAEPFETLDLRWEEAWGGCDTSQPRHLAEEKRNPVGRGVAADPATLHHQPAPRIEDAAHPIRSSKGPQVPAGIGAIPTWFEPRVGYAGTLDDRWAQERMPLRPLDFDERHNQVAPPEMIAAAPLRGGEDVELLNLTPEGALRFRLPRIVFYVGASVDGAFQEHRPMLDLVLIEPQRGWLELTWRSAIPWPRPHRRLESIRVYEKVQR